MPKPGLACDPLPLKGNGWPQAAGFGFAVNNATGAGAGVIVISVVSDGSNTSFVPSWAPSLPSITYSFELTTPPDTENRAVGMGACSVQVSVAGW